MLVVAGASLACVTITLVLRARLPVRTLCVWRGVCVFRVAFFSFFVMLIDDVITTFSTGDTPAGVLLFLLIYLSDASRSMCLYDMFSFL